MKWIKISERLPEKTGKYFTRYKNYNGEQRSASFFDGWKFPHHVTEVEWLDESPVDRGVEKAADSHEGKDKIVIDLEGNENVYRGALELISKIEARPGELYPNVIGRMQRIAEHALSKNK